MKQQTRGPSYQLSKIVMIATPLSRFFSCYRGNKTYPWGVLQIISKTCIHLYNDFMEITGERDKNCPPFVNTCLRTWMERFSVNIDIWADLYLFKFDKWLVDKLKEPLSKKHVGKTRYKLMVAVFGNMKEIKNDPPPKNCQASLDKAPIAS